jgi:hypothetical protein
MASPRITRVIRRSHHFVDRRLRDLKQPHKEPIKISLGRNKQAEFGAAPSPHMAEFYCIMCNEVTIVSLRFTGFHSSYESAHQKVEMRA